MERDIKSFSKAEDGNSCFPKKTKGRSAKSSFADDPKPNSGKTAKFIDGLVALGAVIAFIILLIHTDPSLMRFGKKPINVELHAALATGNFVNWWRAQDISRQEGLLREAYTLTEKTEPKAIIGGISESSPPPKISERETVNDAESRNPKTTAIRIEF